MAVELVAWLLFARTLGAADYGRLSVAFLAARWLGLVSDWGAAQHGSRDVAGGDIDAVAHLQIRRTEVTAACSLAFVLAAAITGNRDMVPLVAVILAGGLNRDWVAVGEHRGRAGSVPIGVRAGLLILGAAVVVTLPAAVIIVSVAYLGWMASSLAFNPNLPWTRRGDGRVHAPPWGLLIVLGAQVYTTLDVVILGWFDGPDAAGVYNAVYRFPLVVTTIVGLLVTALVPPLTSTLRSGDLGFGHARRQLLAIGGAGAAVVLGVTPVAIALVPVVLGPDYVAGRAALVVLMVASAILVVSAPVGALLLAAQRERAVAVVVAAGAVLNLAGNLVLIPRLGMLGAAWTTAASESLVLVCQLVLLRRLCPEEASVAS